MLKLLPLILLTFTVQAQPGCQEVRVIHGLVHLKDKVWETTHENKRTDKVCGKLPKPPRVNIEITISKDGQNFAVELYRPLLGYWDKGGKYEIKYLPIETLAPSWYKGANITVRELPSKKVIVEGKL